MAPNGHHERAMGCKGLHIVLGVFCVHEGPTQEGADRESAMGELSYDIVLVRVQVFLKQVGEMKVPPPAEEQPAMSNRGQATRWGRQQHGSEEGCKHCPQPAVPEATNYECQNDVPDANIQAEGYSSHYQREPVGLVQLGHTVCIAPLTL